MGFNVDRVTYVVEVDDSHNDFAITSVAGNPKVENPKKLKVTGIFKRSKGTIKNLRLNSKDKIHGDNSPMLYALKGVVAKKSV